VFVNCCHLAAFSPDQLLDSDQRKPGGPYDRTLFASGVAEELIKIGVRCVVAAGWAVEDNPARVFAERFYDALMRRESFINAVALAREAAWAEGGNTWAAYQCYGDPDWTFWPAGGDPQSPSNNGGRASQQPVRDPGSKQPEEEFAGVASAQGLILALETIAVGSKFQGKRPQPQQMKIRYLEDRFGTYWGTFGNVAEAFAVAWNEAGDRAKAIDWYRRALAANDGSASIRAAEQLGNLLVRRGETMLAEARRAGAAPKTQTPKPPRKPRGKRSRV
jgi:hypothetical protein